jgi:hypothetical protein
MPNAECRMVNGEWRMANGECRMPKRRLKAGLKGQAR